MSKFAGGKAVGTLAVLGGCAALLLAALAAAAEEKPRALKVGVVDVDRLFREYKRNDDETKRLEDRYKALFEDLSKKEEALREAERRLATEAGESTNIELLKKRQELQLKHAELQAEERRVRAEAAAERVKALNALWSDVLSAAAKFGRDRGYDLIVKQQIDPDMPKSAEDFARNVARRTVLYQAASMDCTNDLLKSLNAEYDRGGPGGERPEKGK